MYYINDFCFLKIDLLNDHVSYTFMFQIHGYNITKVRAQNNISTKYLISFKSILSFSLIIS